MAFSLEHAKLVTLTDEMDARVLLRPHCKAQFCDAMPFEIPQRPLSRHRGVDPRINGAKPFSFLMLHRAVAAVGQSIPDERAERLNVLQNQVRIQQ